MKAFEIFGPNNRSEFGVSLAGYGGGDDESAACFFPSEHAAHAFVVGQARLMLKQLNMLCLILDGQLSPTEKVDKASAIGWRVYPGRGIYPGKEN